MTAACWHIDWQDDDPELHKIGLGVPALSLISLGMKVLPLRRGGKIPHRMLNDLAPPGQGGVHLATADPERARHWWTLDPAANIGVAMGSPSSAVLIDLDVKNGEPGPQHFAEFLAQNRLPFPDAPWFWTPSGGRGIWLRTTPGAQIPERQGILPGVDVIGDGGLSVAPPSRRLVTPLTRSAEQASDPVPIPYRWADGRCPCQGLMAPEWLTPWLESAPSAGRGTGSGEWSGNDSPDLEHLQREGIVRGQRNKTIYVLACSRFRKHGTTPAGKAAVADEIRSVWMAGDQAGLSWHEIARTIESARTFIARQEENDRAMLVQTLQWMSR